MTRLKQVLVLLLVFCFWFSMLGVQMFAEFLDIESLKFVAERLRRRVPFTLRTRFNCFSYYIAFLYFFVIKLGSRKEKMPTLEEKKEEYMIKSPLKSRILYLSDGRNLAALLLNISSSSG